MKKQNFLICSLLFIGVCLVISSSCKKDDDDNGNTFTDTRDGKIYKWVKIGNQTWMAENLAYLPAVSPSSQGSYTDPHYYVYDYQGTNVSEAKAASSYQTYGVLYNWKATNNVCPTGWHLPSDGEWTELETYLADNGYNYDGTTGGGGDKIAKAMASASGWSSASQPGAVGNTDYPDFRNKSGFTLLPAGICNFYGNFSGIGIYTYYWSASEYSADAAWSRYLDYAQSNVFRDLFDNHHGFSVRCLKNQ